MCRREHGAGGPGPGGVRYRWNAGGQMPGKGIPEGPSCRPRAGAGNRGGVKRRADPDSGSALKQVLGAQVVSDTK